MLSTTLQQALLLQRALTALSTCSRQLLAHGSGCNRHIAASPSTSHSLQHALPLQQTKPHSCTAAHAGGMTTLQLQLLPLGKRDRPQVLLIHCSAPSALLLLPSTRTRTRTPATITSRWWLLMTDRRTRTSCLVHMWCAR
jgi:hypothetical protein